ncbi:BTAD domain-containing putative transcriptional regulator [Streptomyces sp. NPDC050535]|uniref:AfsR/SARP family transcriptional regulator n=1 Tax=Streptomyces sp. NPDC050535 TaxID=3365626 RepID=UPI00378C1445
MVDGMPRAVPGRRRKAVLAGLALHPGEIVSTDRLIDIVWGDSAPATAANTLQSHVSYLRRVLGARTAILARPPGYILDLGDEATDVEVAERLVRQGSQCPDRGRGATQLEAAVALWRGQPLADVAGPAWFDGQVHRLDHLLLQARQALIESRLALGQHAQLVPELESLSRQYPLHEQLCGQLMLALYRAGRQADALAAYQRLRRVLDEDLGLSPVQDLRDLEAAVLRQDATLEPPLPPPSPPVAGAVPAQLPMAVAGFAGRAGELARLDGLVDARAARPAAVVISVVSGTAGVGKTALALHWAHRVAGRFPDGQLYVNLRGFDPGGSVVDPADAVREFLDVLGVPVQRIPAGAEARVSLYRSLLAGKRVLVLLDNARDAEQVRPLLPGTPGCLVVVTSRNQLTPLVVAEGAQPLTLDVLTVAEARELLTARLGTERVTAETIATSEIIGRCARLPLALAIASARASTRPRSPLSGLADELRDGADAALDAFRGGDPASDVRAVFSWSYQALNPDAARLFRLLGLHPGPDIAPHAAASLAGLPLRQTSVLLTELAHAHLLTEQAAGRYSFHDLLRTYAAELVTLYDSEAARHTAVNRMLDHYLHTARTGAVLLDEPYFTPVTAIPALPGVTRGEPVTAEGAQLWFAAEHAALLAAVHLAAEAGLDTHTWQLASALTVYFVRCGHWHDQTSAQSAALDAARRIEDPVAEAHALHDLAYGYARSGRCHDARPHLRHALRLFEEAGEQTSQARTHLSLSWLSDREDRPAEALVHALRALDLFRATGNPTGQTRVLNEIGWCHARLGHHQRALVYCEQALAAYQEAGERVGESATWDSLGFIHSRLGNHEQAVISYQRSLDLCREFGDRYDEANTLADLGDTHQGSGDSAAARRAWLQAVDILDQLDHPYADLLRARLHAHERPQAGTQ